MSGFGVAVAMFVERHTKCYCKRRVGAYESSTARRGAGGGGGGGRGADYAIERGKIGGYRRFQVALKVIHIK